MITYFVTVLSITGTVANAFKKRWCFILWGFTNIFWATYNALNKQYAQAILYSFNLLMAIVGYIKWGKDRNQTKQDLKKQLHKLMIKEYGKIE